MLRQLLLLCFLLATASVAQKHIATFSLKDSPAEEVLYLPNGKNLKLISFGYQNVLAHTLWFNTINYFGKHYQSDRNYQWLNHMCGLVTTLNPSMSDVYEFCSLMLTWEANSPQLGKELLDKANLAFPNNWKFLYLRGINYLIFLKDEEKAKLDFIAASTLPGVHPYVVRLAAKKISVSDNAETAIEFLEEAIQNSKQEWEKNALLEKLDDLKKQRDQHLVEGNSQNE